MKIKVLTLFGLLAVLSGCAAQQDIVVLEERLIAVENKAMALQRQNERLQGQIQQEVAAIGSESQSKEKNLRSQYASMNVSLESIEQQLARLNGRIDEIDHAVKAKLADVDSTGRRLDDVSLSVAKVDQKVGQIEQYLNLDEAGKVKANGGSSAATAGAGKTGQDFEKQLYDKAKQAYDNGQLDKARQGFAQLIKSYPNSTIADNAQFWIGESYYREKWYEKAILEYQTVLDKYPKGNKVPAAMLKQGLAFLQLGDKSNARLILQELEKKYPKTNEARIAKRKLAEF
ncbi:MAG: tol-pal system protein YbgF [Desulfosarcinaceae bacterium]